MCIPVQPEPGGERGGELADHALEGHTAELEASGLADLQYQHSYGLLLAVFRNHRK